MTRGGGGGGSSTGISISVRASTFAAHPASDAATADSPRAAVNEQSRALSLQDVAMALLAAALIALAVAFGMRRRTSRAYPDSRTLTDAERAIALARIQDWMRDERTNDRPGLPRAAGGVDLR